MPLDFPNTPTLNQTFTYGSYSWIWDGSVWLRQDVIIAGDKGGVKYAFSTTTTDSDPGAGYFRYNSSTMSSVSSIYVQNTDASGVNQSAWLATWDDTTPAVRGQVIVIGNRDNTVNVFNITGASTSVANYYKIAVSYVSGSLPTNLSNYMLQFTAFGTGPVDYVATSMLYR